MAVLGMKANPLLPAKFTAIGSTEGKCVPGTSAVPGTQFAHRRSARPTCVVYAPHSNRRNVRFGSLP
jgi:hypothetical protein